MRICFSQRTAMHSTRSLWTMPKRLDVSRAFVRAGGQARLLTGRVTQGHRILLGASLLAIPFGAQALNAQPVVQRVDENDYKVLKPIVDDIIRLVRLQRLGLIKGSIRIGLSGPTGAGKSTLAEMVREWLLRDTSAKVEVLHGD